MAQGSAQDVSDIDLNMDQAARPYLLGILEAIEADSAVSQRKIAERLGIALGLVNTYLRWCVRKGWVKMQHIPARRYAYYVTPQGFLEKSALVGAHIQQSFALFRDAHEECQSIFETLMDRAVARVLLVGGGDLQDFAAMIAAGTPLECRKVKAIADIGALSDGDAIVLTDLNNSQLTYNALVRSFPQNRIFVLPLLRVHEGAPQ